MKMKKYYGVVALICSALSCAMEREHHSCNNECYQIVRKRIDTEMLGVQSEGLLGRLSGTIASYRQRPTDREETIKALCDVESKIPDGCSKYHLFSELNSWHDYFKGLINNTISYKYEQWDTITGATLGSLFSSLSESNLDDRLSPQLDSHIHCTAVQPYSTQRGLFENIDKRNFELDDIHYVVIPGNGMGMQSVSLIESDQLKLYVKKTGWDGTISFYSLDNESECLQVPSTMRETICPEKQYKVHVWQHMIAFGLVDLMCIRTIMQSLYANSNDKKIVVFQHPTFESYLCSKAFAASQNNKQELTVMREFVEKTRLIWGFVKRNLLQKIVGRLKELEK